MTVSSLDLEPACPAPIESPGSTAPEALLTLRAERRPFASIARETWDGLAASNPWATPFSAWAFHRAWWDAYGANAQEETLVVVPADGPSDAEPIAILPLMHRHEVEPSDGATHTQMRHADGADLTPVPGSATAIFFGASYHADYATILAAPDTLPAVSAAIAAYIASRDPVEWDAFDLRRLRCGDPVAEQLADALGPFEIAQGWTLNIEREDVCPVVTLPASADIEDYLATLGKKERHEIRRKVRRAEAFGEIAFDASPDPLADLETFITLHQSKWGEAGLFPATTGGEQSRVFFRRLFELFGSDGPLKLSFLSVGGKRIAAGVHFETADGVLYYNAGVDPEARELSPGVVMVYAYVEQALQTGKRRMDFLRGNEPYKYEWGAVDEPIQRLLIRRTV